MLQLREWCNIVQYGPHFSPREQEFDYSLVLRASKKATAHLKQKDPGLQVDSRWTPVPSHDIDITGPGI